MKESMWSPWHGCHKFSQGCKNCYVYYLDKKREKDASVVSKNKSSFYLPIKKDRQGNYKIVSGSTLATCFTSDFFLEEADAWRVEAWEMIKMRSDVKFLIPTKRIHRFKDCIPFDWKDGYENVEIALSCENQEAADMRIPLFLELPIKVRKIFLSPILEYVDLKPYLKTGLIDEVSVGGESYENARICDFDWVKKIYQDCKELNVKFDFHQTGSNFKKDGKIYKIHHHEEHMQAKKAMEYLKLNKC